MRYDPIERVDNSGLLPRRDCKNEYGAPNEEEVRTCQSWIRLHCTPTKTIRPTRGSYGLKHDVERWTESMGEKWTQVDPWGRTWSSNYIYVSNGAFIVAMQREGYRVERQDWGSINAYFNASYRKMKEGGS